MSDPIVREYNAQQDDIEFRIASGEISRFEGNRLLRQLDRARRDEEDMDDGRGARGQDERGW